MNLIMMTNSPLSIRGLQHFQAKVPLAEREMEQEPSQHFFIDSI